jgi:hypothetical protein
MPAQAEHIEQVTLMHMLGIIADELPEVRLMFAIPNGGARHPAVAGKLKAEGVKAGVPDLFLPVGHEMWNGLFIEMKAPKGRLSPQQKEWIDALDAQGYRCEVCYGAEAAFNAILGYLEVVPDLAERLRRRVGMAR